MASGDNNSVSLWKMTRTISSIHVFEGGMELPMGRYCITLPSTNVRVRKMFEARLQTLAGKLRTFRDIALNI